MPLAHTLPIICPIAWEFRSLTSAETSFTVLEDGRLEIVVKHAVLKGVTPEMLHWWFGNIEGTMEYTGRIYPRYLVWHPLDHISFRVVQPAPDGTVNAGARIRIVEAFGHDLNNLVDAIAIVEKRDLTGAAMVKRLLGMEVFRLENHFMLVDGGTTCTTRMVVGSASLLGRLLFNRTVRPRLFSNAKGKAWMKHQVEEMGNLEHFLPTLYAQCINVAP